MSQAVSEASMQDLILKLHAIGAIKLGTFEIKKNFMAPFHVDFKGVISRPEVAKQICSLIWEKAQHLSYDLLCGAPLIGACFANFLAWDQNLPLILRRINVKNPELCTKIEGTYKTGQRCLVIQDINLSGMDALETIEDLEGEGIEVRDVLAFIDLELGSRKKIKSRGYVPHFVLSISDALQTLFDAGKIPGDKYKIASDFLSS